MSILTFAQDFTSNVTLDESLKGTPDSGLFWNRGVHPLLTLENILSIAPNLEFTFSAYNAGTTYSNYETSFEVVNIVSYQSKIYQSLSDSNTGNTPNESPLFWLETNIESLRIKTLINSSKEDMIAATMLSRKLLENQYIYNIGSNLLTIPNDYAGWCFEPKGSDYVKIRINEISFQANTDVQQNLYVVNQGVLIDTLVLNPQNGTLVFERLNYTISGKGAFYFLVDSQDVISDQPSNDSLKYNAFVAYPVSGTGETPEDAEISISNSGNGLNFNISAYLDSAVFIENNLIDFARLWQLEFAYNYIRMAIHNVNTRSNRQQRNINDSVSLATLQVESLDLKSMTVAKQYNEELKAVKNTISKTFDNFLKPINSPFKTRRGTF